MTRNSSAIYDDDGNLTLSEIKKVLEEALEDYEDSAFDDDYEELDFGD